MTQKTEDVKPKLEIESGYSPYCQSNCKICKSGHAGIVCKKVQAGELYVDIVSYLRDKYNFSISPASITRHWTNYKKALVEHGMTRDKMKQFDDEADELIRHQKQVTAVADGMFKLIIQQMEAGTLPVSVTDYASLLKIRHGVLTGDNGAMDDLVGIFQQATDKYGVNLQQGVLFKKSK